MSAGSVLAFIALTWMIVRYTKAGIAIQDGLLQLQEQQCRSQCLQTLLSERQMVKGEWDDLITAFMSISRAHGKIHAVRILPANRLPVLQQNQTYWDIGSLRLAADLAERHIGQGIFTNVDLFVSLYEIVQQQVVQHGDAAAYGASGEVTAAIDGLQQQWQIIDPAFGQALQSRGARLNQLHEAIRELLPNTTVPLRPQGPD